MVQTRSSTNKRRRLDPSTEKTSLVTKQRGPPCASQAPRLDDDETCPVQEKERTKSSTVSRRSQVHHDMAQDVRSDDALAASFEDLPTELFSKIFLFLDSPRKVFNLAMCSKALYDAVTPEIVVRATVFGEYIPYEVLRYHIMVDLKLDAIHVPSTFRMLRLILATRCEMMDQCFGLNLKTNLSHSLGNSKTRYSGLAICCACATSLMARRSQFKWCGNSFTIFTPLLLPLQENVTGTPTGPLITAQMMRRVASSYRAPSCRLVHLNEIIAKVREERAEEDLSRRQSFLLAFEQAVSELPAFLRAKYELCEQQARQREARMAARKRENCSKVLHVMNSVLGDYHLKDIVLAHVWSHNGSCVFKCGISKWFLGRCMKAPSYHTKKSIREAVVQAQEAFDTLYSCGLPVGTAKNLEDIIHLPANASAAERALCQYLIVRHNVDSLLTTEEDYGAFIESVQLGKLLHACFSRLSQAQLRAVFKMAAKIHAPEAFRDNEELSQLVWIRHHGPNVARLDTMKQFQKQFNQCMRSYKMMVVYFKRFLRKSETVAFLSQASSELDPEDPFAYARHDIAGLLFTKPRNDWIDALINGSYEWLLAQHEREFEISRRRYQRRLQNDQIS